MINEMENGMQSKGYFTVPLQEKSFCTEATGDFTLPDYQNEIRRILSVSQTVLPPAKYLSDSSVEFNGTIDYQVLYVGGDGGTYSIPLSSDYSFTVPLEQGAQGTPQEDICVLCSVSAESVSTRVSAPRRLSLRSRIRPNVRVYARLGMVTELENEVEPQNIYRKIAACPVLCVKSASSDIINLKYVAPYVSEETRVVSAQAYVEISDVSAGAEGINCKGTARIKILCVDEATEEYSTIRAEVPFECTLDTDESVEGFLCRAKGQLAEMSVSVSDAGIECNAGITVDAVACSNLSVEYTDDVFSTSRDCRCEQKTLQPRRLLYCRNSNFTLSERIALDSVSVPLGAEPVDCTANIIMDSCEAIEGKYVFGGTAVFSLLYRKDGENLVAEVSVPVKYACDADGSAEAVSFDACADAGEIKVRISEDSLCIDAEIAICADCFGESCVSAVSKVIFGEENATGESELIVCYPCADDSVWSVAKKYKVAPSAIIGDPTLDKYIIIE